MKQIFFGILCIISLTIWAQDVPDSPAFQSASVVPGANPGNVVLNWTASDSLDVEGYYIFKVNAEGISNYLDTVWGRETTTYTNSLSAANGQIETYRLAAFDTLDNISLLTEPHTTIYAFPYYDKCDLSVNLDWNEYIGWNAVSSYNIHRVKAGGSYSLIASIDGNTTNYLDENLAANELYAYYVEAVRADGTTATSNEAQVFTSAHTPPSYLNADFANVNGSEIELAFSVDTAGETIEYKLKRAVDTPANWSTIATFSDVNSLRLFYTDSFLEPATKKYYYKLESIDPCNNVSAESNLASNIILSVSTDRQLTHYLSWDNYVDYQGEVMSYQIIRRYGDESPTSLTVFNNANFQHKQNISSYVNERHDMLQVVPYTYCYSVLAIENGANNPIGMQGQSKSNEVCVSHKPRVYIPNAFYPNSYVPENRVFKPFVSFVVDTNYEFIVYDRWGQPIFRTNDQTEGWDGVSGNNKAAAGKYVYFVSYQDFEGKKHRKSGIFFLNRN